MAYPFLRIQKPTAAATANLRDRLPRQNDVVPRRQSSTSQASPCLRSPTTTVSPTSSVPLTSAIHPAPRSTLHVYLRNSPHLFLEYQRHRSLPPALHPAHYHLPQACQSCFESSFESRTTAPLAPHKPQAVAMAPHNLPPRGQDRPHRHQDPNFRPPRRQHALGFRR